MIIQCQDLLDAEHPSTLIIPLTTNLIENAVPLRFRILAEEKLKQDSDLLIDQLRAIDNKRLVDGPLLTCSPSTMKQVDSCVAEIVGL